MAFLVPNQRRQYLPSLQLFQSYRNCRKGGFAGRRQSYVEDEWKPELQYSMGSWARWFAFGTNGAKQERPICYEVQLDSLIRRKLLRHVACQLVLFFVEL